MRPVPLFQKGMEDMKKRTAVLAFLLLFLAGAGEGAGWYNMYTGGVWNNPGSCLIDTMIYNKTMANATLKTMQKNQSQGTRPQKQTPQAPQASRARPTTYRPSGKPSPVPSALARTLTDRKADRDTMTAFFNEALANYGDYARQAKRPNDLGLAMAFFFGVCIGITTDNQVDDPAIFAAARQMDVVLAEQTGVGSAPDAKKEEMAHTLACLATFALAGVTQAEEEDNPEGAESFRELARQSMSEVFGIDVDSVKMDHGGLRILD